MIISRKHFLRVTGGSLLVAAGERWVEAFAGAAQNVPAKALTARRWAMVIDLPKCLQEEDCVKCIEACHRAHNVPAIPEPSHQVKWIRKAFFESVFPSQNYVPANFVQNYVPTLCNHCAEPPCVRVCPTQATWKREDGIVMMDWHRCIGCRYCMAACPYGSRSFNWMDPRPHIAQLNPDFPSRTKGVVEKCNFCEERLAKGQLPACVEACSAKALVCGDLGDENSKVRQLLRARYSMQRKPELGTNPGVSYLV
jgi:molybdopterin-containing oxidoreductase family iron-sulfur binding subunit